MYLNIKSCVTVEGDDSPFFFCNRGVRQGENISPVHVLLHLNDLDDYFEAKRSEGMPIECKTKRMYFLCKYTFYYMQTTR